MKNEWPTILTKVWLYHLPALSPREVYLIALWFSFLISKNEMIKEIFAYADGLTYHMILSLCSK